MLSMILDKISAFYSNMAMRFIEKIGTMKWELGKVLSADRR